MDKMNSCNSKKDPPKYYWHKKGKYIYKTLDDWSEKGWESVDLETVKDELSKIIPYLNSLSYILNKVGREINNSQYFQKSWEKDMREWDKVKETIDNIKKEEKKFEYIESLRKNICFIQELEEKDWFKCFRNKVMDEVVSDDKFSCLFIDHLKHKHKDDIQSDIPKEWEYEEIKKELEEKK